ncbi:MAG TPA: ester cyclase [Thermoanaerobaculia bacterium]|nr:ester cyclase [Thermoanaerobaculia bacterium]
MKVGRALLLASSLSMAAGTAALAQDPVELSPQMYSILFENDHVRVLDFRAEPGDKEPLHSHPAAVAYILADGKIRSTTKNGESEEIEPRAGTAVWVDSMTHTYENLAPTSAHVLIIEMKDLVTAGEDGPDLETRLRNANDALLNQGNLDVVPRFFLPTYVNHLVDKDVRGSEAITDFVKRVRAAFPDLEVQIQVLATQGERVAWLRTHRGTHRGNFMGVPASGRVVVWRDMVVTRYEADMIAEEWGVSELGARLRAQ